MNWKQVGVDASIVSGVSGVSGVGVIAAAGLSELASLDGRAANSVVRRICPTVFLSTGRAASASVASGAKTGAVDYGMNSDG